jgi:hypothetical protein
MQLDGLRIGAEEYHPLNGRLLRDGEAGRPPLDFPSC